ncbi:MAG: thymidine phosphorylase family protein [Rickettsiales bacterium]|jgi:thymidine phosphorylase|nr:thymidine phosphorylase family protein [Rickettsiales bacterium]
MKLKVKNIGIDSGREPTAYLNGNSEIVKYKGFSPLARVKIYNDKTYSYATLNLVEKSDLVGENEIGVSHMVMYNLKAQNGDEFEIEYIEPLLSFTHIRRKLRGKPFTQDGIMEVLADVVIGKYTDMHMACLCAATEGDQLSGEEVAYLTEAMIKSGGVINWGKDIVVDKHCIGGIPGNRTTPISIAIVAEYGLYIPKTSSRAITSAAGTADVMEVFTNVVVSSNRMREIVEKVGGCLVWGGGVDLNPSDDIIINVKKDLNLDSKGQMLASIISKKVAAGSTHILIDIPYGPSAKVKTEAEAEELKRDFESLGGRLGVKVVVDLTDGSQPIGNGIGPALEAADIVKVLKNEKDAPRDLMEKSIYLSGIVIEFDPKVKKGDGEKIAKEILESGRAWERFVKICEAQGGMKKIPTAKLSYDVLAKKNGAVREFDNKKLSHMAKLAGCPGQPAAGVFLYKHVGDRVTNGEKLFTIYSDSQGEMDLAIQLATEFDIMKVE